MKKRFIGGFLGVTLLALAACGEKEVDSIETTSVKNETDAVTETPSTEKNDGNGETSSSLEEEIKNDFSPKDAFSISDIAWSVDAGNIEGESVVIFSYTNNTGYTIADVEMEFIQKEGVTAEELAVFDGLKEEREWTDEEVAEIYILGYNRKIADPEETVDRSPCVINGTYQLVENIEQYEIMEPSTAKIAYIGSDDKMYAAYYDFKTDSYDWNPKGQDIHEWSDSAISNLIPKSEARVVKVSYDDEDRFFFYAYGVSLDEYAAYVEASKEKGFSEPEFENDTTYRALNSDNYEFSINYNDIEETMTGCIEKVE